LQLYTYNILTQLSVQSPNRWLKTQLARFKSTPSLEVDSIDEYMNTDPESLAPYDRLLSYWSAMLEIKPCVAQMALDYLTAPGKL
jgi:hypothetical protein